VNVDFAVFHRKTLARAQVERHTRPAPVVDLGLDRHKGFDRALAVGTFFLEITWHRLAFDVAVAVLAADDFLAQVRAGNRPQRF